MRDLFSSHHTALIFLFSVRVCTYNVQAQSPPNNLDDWLFEGAELERPDLYVFGMQELDRSAEALLYSTSTVKEDAWFSAIVQSLGSEQACYEKVCLPLPCCCPTLRHLTHPYHGLSS